ncbi:MAG TPA: DUF2279 domain-containing protein, partial [Chitinophagaceae bacterium]|nr:DUF2279 domain-containing protein [Chitinophagaceae bacterium]
ETEKPKETYFCLMKPAPVQNSSFLATFRSGFCSFFTILIIIFFFPVISFSQIDTLKIDSVSKNIRTVSTDTFGVSPYYYLTPEQKRKRQWLVGGINVVGYGASLIIFSNTWYKDYPKTSFHTFDDSKEWLQMDKVGHAWAAYNTGRASTDMWKWAGLSNKKATWIGGLSGTVYLTVIEFLDAHSAKWGWSWSDMAANILGSGLFISQQLGWEEQRIQFKFSFHYKNYSDPMLNERSDDLFGSSSVERMLKDYNGQTYWLSANLRSFFQGSNIPAWLNVAVGYGADGMFGGFQNIWIDEDTGIPVNRTDIKRYRQWFLAPDVNFSKIKTNKKGVKVLLGFLDAFKFPTPSLELSNGKLKVHAIHF